MPIPVALRLLAGLTVVAVAACDATGSGQGTTPEPTATPNLAGTSWALSSIGGSPPVAAGDAWLGFGENGEITGSTGCNNLIGSYTVDGTAMSFSTLGTTRMACPDDDVMAQDASMPEALTNVTGWQVDADGRLHLTGGTELIFDLRPK